MAALHNPERAWAQPAGLTSVDPSEIERRIGSVRGRVELLSGGLANLNLHIEGQGVLRIYRSGLGGPRLEAQLLSLPWQHLRVPRVLQEGSDFLLLEHVPHTPLQDREEHGWAAGAALAEIHARHFPQAGLLSPELVVSYSLGLELELLLQHALEHLQRAGRAELGPELERCFALTRSAPSTRSTWRSCWLARNRARDARRRWRRDFGRPWQLPGREWPAAPCAVGAQGRRDEVGIARAGA